MLIREYTPKDIPAIFKINRLCHKNYQPNIQLLESIHDGQLWVAEVEGVIAGFLLSIYRDGPYVYNVAVLPQYRNKGIASKLFETFELENKEFGFYYLYVDYRNPAQKLYFDLGYRVTSIKKDFYGKSENALVMVKKSGLSASIPA
jgi:ribosomal protein S18 acetylase RimI-like enzyme